MKAILQFLKGDLKSASEEQDRIDVSKEDLDSVRQMFKNNEQIEKRSKYFKSLPSISKNQIWSVRDEYIDFEGISQATLHPFLVLINSELDQIEEESFVRVFVISPFVELASSADEICKDSSIIGFPFLIESWNNQPMLTEILNEYIGYYEPKLNSFFETDTVKTTFEAENSTSTIEEINTIHQEFMEIEIYRSKYLSHSISSLLTFLENKQSLDSGVVVSIFNKTDYPIFYIGENKKEPIFSLAAKSGFTSEDKFMIYKDNSLPFEMFFRKNEDGFILTIQPMQSFKFFGPDNMEIEGVSNQEKTVFDKLKKGYYTLVSENIQEPLKIRLK